MKKKLVIFSAILIPVLGALAYLFLQNSGMTVDVFTVSTGSVIAYVEESALVASHDQHLLVAKAMGELAELNAEVGDEVTLGQVVSRLDTEEIDLQIKSVEARLDAVRASYRKYLSSIKTSTEVAQANLRSAEIMLEEARRDYDSSKQLYESGAISLSQYQQVRDYLQLQEESVAVAEQELGALGGISSESARQEYEAQIADLTYQIEILKDKREDMWATSPIDGTVLDIGVKEGAFLQTGSPIMEIADSSNLYLEADVLVGDVGRIGAGQNVEISSDELGIAGVGGHVSKVHPKALTKLSDLGIEQRRVKVEIAIDEIPATLLRIGYELDVRIITGQRDDVLYVPESAVFSRNGQNFVFGVDDSGKAHLLKVAVGLEGEDTAEIVSGLKAGDIVIKSPGNEISDGTKVKIER